MAHVAPPSAPSREAANASPAPEQADDLANFSRELESRPAQERVQWAIERYQPKIFLSSSFGAQAAVSLHLVNQVWPSIPVVLIDTGYLFPETYQFIDTLAERFALQLKIYRSPFSPAWQEARYGQLWTQGVEGIKRYNEINKVEPMRRAVQDLGARAWITGLRRKQSSSREHLGVLAFQDGIVKVHPIIDWNDREIFQYLKQNDLPYHPLWEQGYVSIGDTHTTRRLTDGMDESQARFFGLVRECGLHVPSGASFEI
jgi:phosphoadenosine phosphosulfate reductase